MNDALPNEVITSIVRTVVSSLNDMDGVLISISNSEDGVTAIVSKRNGANLYIAIDNEKNLYMDMRMHLTNYGDMVLHGPIRADDAPMLASIFEWFNRCYELEANL